MKKQSALVLAMLLCILAVSTLSSSKYAGSDPLPPADAVGQPNPNGPPTVFVNALKKSFKEGGTILAFNIVNLSGNWKLLRKGNINGGQRTEIVPVSLVGGYFRFISPAPIKVCFVMNCPSEPAPQFCNPKMDASGCDCNYTNTPCEFGTPPYELVTEDIFGM